MIQLLNKLLSLLPGKRKLLLGTTTAHAALLSALSRRGMLLSDAEERIRVLEGEVSNLRLSINRRGTRGMALTGHYCPVCNEMVNVHQRGAITQCKVCDGATYNLQAVDVKELIHSLHVSRSNAKQIGIEIQAIHRKLDGIVAIAPEDRRAILDSLRRIVAAPSPQKDPGPTRAKRSISI